MKTNILTYMAALCCLLLLDAIWLGIVAKDSYQQAMGHIMRDTPLVWPWVVFYLLYPLAIVILAVLPQQIKQSHYLCLGRGFVLGAAAYGAYNLTNVSLLEGWPLLITFKDWLWGSLLTATVAWVGGRVYIKLAFKQSH